MEMYSVDETNGVKNFDALSFERKIVELVEELRLRRNLEVENEKNLKSCMEEKYNLEIQLDDQQRKRVEEKESLKRQISFFKRKLQYNFYDTHDEKDDQDRKYITEKESLEREISVLKRKLEDNICVSDDEKAKQQIMNKTYSQEVRALKEELRNAGSERLNLTKKIQALEAQLKLHTNYQDSIVKQIVEIRNRLKELTHEREKLRTSQEMVMSNIKETKVEFCKFDQSHKHLMECIAITENLNKDLKKELVSCRSELTMSKSSTPVPLQENNSDSERVICQKRIIELEKLFLQSRKENEKTLNNLVESNNRLCSFINKCAELREIEKTLSLKTENYEKEFEILQNKLDEQVIELERLRLESTRAQVIKEVEEAQTQTELEIDEKAFPQTDTSTSKQFENKYISENEKLDVFPLLKNKIDIDVLNIQPNEANEVSKRKRHVAFVENTDNCDQPFKKPCSERNFVNQMYVEHDNDLSLPSSMDSSQNSVICCDDNIGISKNSKYENSFTGDIVVNETDAKELMNVEKNLKNLQVFDYENVMNAASKEEGIQKQENLNLETPPKKQ